MTNPQFIPDIEAISSIDAVPVILSMVKHLTGMRFAAVARVTERNWVACAVDDSIDFGLKPGGELVLESTICHEIRQHQQPVIFGHASAHPIFSRHHTPQTYGLESYISIRSSKPMVIFSARSAPSTQYRRISTNRRSPRPSRCSPN